MIRKKPAVEGFFEEKYRIWFIKGRSHEIFFDCFLGALGGFLMKIIRTHPRIQTRLTLYL